VFALDAYTHSSRLTKAPVAACHEPAANCSSLVSHQAPGARVDEQTCQAMIAQAAYFRAEKRDFRGGGELSDWLEAEREITRMLDG
jgi:hypothetical protein